MTKERILEILEGAKDKTGSVPMSLVRRAFENISNEPHWISCGERLPEEDGEYLVTFERGYAEDYGFDLVGIAPYKVDCEGFGTWQEEFDRYTLGSLGSEWVDIKVLAWMPLPSPYQPEEESE